MSRKTAERDQRKKLILDGALKSYSEKGIDKMTMDDIALHSDFGKATIYYYFPSKEDIVCSLLETGWRNLWESVEESVIENVSPKSKFVNILKQMSDIVFHDRLLYEFLFTAPRNIKISDDKASWKDFQKRTYATLHSIVDDGMKSGEFPSIEPNLFMKAVGGIFHGIVFMGEQKKLEQEDIEKLISNFISPS